MIALLALLALAVMPRLEAPAVASTRASGQIVAKEVRHDDPTAHGTLARLGGGTASAASVGSTGGDTLALTSEVIDPGQRFDYVGVHWQPVAGKESSVLVELRTSADGATWTDWRLLQEEEDMADEVTNERYAAPVNVGDARYAQYRIWLTDGDTADARAVGLTFMDVSDLNASPLARLGNDLAGAWRDLQSLWSADAAATQAIRIRTRAEWGADESLMQWTPQYVPWKKAIVHHTVTSNTYTDPTAEIRSIYYYHAVTRGWGDIGYNFLVDRFGTIWTGRQGGDDVVGGHAYGWNQGSIGIAALGDFSTLSANSYMLSAYSHIIAMKFAQRGIQPLGNDTFTHKEEDSSGNLIPVTSSPPNIQGHRDCSYVIGISGGQTACPGGALYLQLATIRNLAQTAWTDGYTYLPSYTTNLQHFANTASTQTVNVTVKNTGRATIPATGTTAAKLAYRILNASSYAQVAQGPLVSLTADLLPAQSQTYAMTVVVPTTTGRYLVRWDLSANGAAWYSALFNAPTRDEWLYAVEWDDTFVSDNTPTTMSVGQSAQVQVKIQNTGARAWPAANVRLSYHWVSDLTQRVVVWNGNRGYLPSDVQPGQTVTVPITVTAPSYPTRYQIQYDLVWEGSFWFGDKGVDPLVRIVNVPFDFKATYVVPQSLSIQPGQSTTVPVTVTNTGTSTWLATGTPTVDLGTHWYASDGTLVNWDGARTPLPKNLAPGQSATFNANVTAPATLGTYLVKFDLALEGLSWFSSKGVTPATMPTTVKPPTYGAVYTPGSIGTVAAASVTTSVPMTLQNTSDFPWSTTDFHLAYHLYDSSGALLKWDGTRTLLPSTVQAGQTVTLQATLDLPTTSGTYLVKWDMVQEGVTWFSGKGVAPAAQTVTVGPPVYAATYGTSAVPPMLQPGSTSTVYVYVTNGSNFAFLPATSVYLAYHWYDGSGALVKWDGLRTTLSIPVGGAASVAATVQAPATPGTYRLAFDLVQEGVTWFSGKGTAPGSATLKVASSPYGATYVVPGDQAGAVNATLSLPVTVANTGARTWSASVVHLSYHVYQRGTLVGWDGARTSLPNDVATGGSATVNAAVRLPATPGSYEIRFDLVEEGVTWFSSQGVSPARLFVTVQ